MVNSLHSTCGLIEKDLHLKNNSCFFYFVFYSFWGKFAQRNNLKKRAIISDEAEFFRKVTNPTQRIVDWHILNEEMV